MIRKFNHLTEILPGQWICMEPIMLDHICSPPREVVRRSGKRVYFKNRHGEDEGQHCATSSIFALCDTREEAARVFAVSESQAAVLASTRMEHKARAEALFA